VIQGLEEEHGAGGNERPKLKKGTQEMTRQGCRNLGLLSGKWKRDEGKNRLAKLDADSLWAGSRGKQSIILSTAKDRPQNGKYPRQKRKHVFIECRPARPNPQIYTRVFEHGPRQGGTKEHPEKVKRDEACPKKTKTRKPI